MDTGGKFHTTAALPQLNSPSTNWTGSLGKPQGQSEFFWIWQKVPDPASNETTNPQTSRPLPSHYTYLQYGSISQAFT